MKTIIAALISGICGIIVAVIALIPKMNQTYDRLIQHEKDQEKEHGNLSREHSNLSGEHKQIRQEMVSEQKEVLGSLSGVARQVNTLYVEQIKANERHQSLSQKQLDLAAMVEKISDLMSEVARVNYENQQLHQTIQQLEAKLAQQPPLPNHAPASRREDWELEP